MGFDLGRLRVGETIAAVDAILLLIVMFLGWYEPHGIEDLDIDLAFSAWEAFSVIDLILLVTVAAALTLAVVTATERTPALPVTAAVAVTVLGLLSTLLVLFRVLIDQPGLGLGATDADLDNTLWAWVGLICCAAIAYGGYRALRAEGETSAGAPVEVRRVRDAEPAADGEPQPPAS